MPGDLDGDQPSRVVHRCRRLDRRALSRERQRHSRVDRPRSIELAQPARIAWPSS
jgi:hypothetical protein